MSTAVVDAATPAASVVAPFLATAHRRWLLDEPGTRWRGRPATLVYAVVSGLTALTDRLTAPGTVSAGELTALLDGAVGRLFDTAISHGGDLLKSSGDVLLVAFEGPGHERRATQAAAALPAALRGLPGETAGVQLEVSIGVATGELDLFLVGEDHRELVVCGALVSAAVRLQREARPGEVLADGTTAAAVNDGRWSGPHGGGHLLLLPPPASTVGLGLSPNGVHELPAAELLRGVPTGLRAHVGSAADGQHRQVAVAWIQVTGVDDLLDRAGPAAVADALDDVIGAAQAACAAHGATFLSTEADAGAVTVVLAGGAPDTGTDSVGRLLLAARKVASVRGALAVRAGVHHGPAFTVEVGSTRRRVYTVLGDVVHVAARMARRAERGVVVATDSSLTRSRTRFEARPVHAASPNGGAQQVAASAVGPPLGEAAYRAATSAPLVGRDRERRALLAALDDARAGVGRVMVIAGDAGIGKSRLVAEVVAAAPDLARLHVTAGAIDADHPYGSLRAPLRRLLNLDAEASEAAVVASLRDVVGPSGEQWLPLMAPAFGVIIPDTAATAAVETPLRRSRSHALLTTLLRRLLPDRALVVVEDAHWLDHASTGLLHHVAKVPSSAPWLVVVTRRDQPGGLELLSSEQVTHDVVQPLTPEAAAALLDAAGPDRLPEPTRDAIIARAGGNPLLLEQLRASVESGIEIDALPHTVEEVVDARIAALVPARRRELRAASVLGQRFPASQLAALLGDPDVDPAGSFPGLLELDEPGWIRFLHPLVWARAYRGLSQRSRRDLHDRAGQLVEADGSMTVARHELLSLHCTEAQRWSPAWRWSVLAAERSAAMAAPLEAARFLRRAVRAAGHLDLDASELSWLYERLADAEELNGRPDEAIDALTRARRLVSDPVRLAHLLRRHGRISDEAGSWVAAQRWFSRGLRELSKAPQTADAERARIDLVIAQASTKLHQSRLREAAALLEGAVAAADAIGHRPALATASNLLSKLHDR